MPPATVHGATTQNRAARITATSDVASSAKQRPLGKVDEVPEPGLRDRQHEDGPRAARVVQSAAVQDAVVK